ncbi:hypothetical protein [Rufibacter tibetensis]|uniref:hypothetical protein n=1 Tax=Rufibacter tibetensis TaxID=512763 RepID=UPI0012FADBC3|nr:hypothetical protein [Rufibacter tibetensis]
MFENSIIKLVYEPATDVLEVTYPDLHDYLLPEIKHSISILADHVKSFDVKRLLLDSSRTSVSVGEEESKAISTFLAAELMKTRLQKLARLQSASPAIESSAEKNITHIKQAGMLPFQLQNFESKPEALKWLISNI